MTNSEPPVPAHGALRWFAALIGAAPHLAIVMHSGLPHEFSFMAEENQIPLVTFAAYGSPELYIVPATLLISAGLWVVPRTRFLALWLLFGTLAGATVVLLTLISAARAEIALVAPA